MRITENFTHPDSRSEPQQVTVFLNTAATYNCVELHFSVMTPRIRLQDLDILIGMLQAVQRRASREVQT